MRRLKSSKRFSKKAVVLAVAALCSAGAAQAFKIDTGPDWDVNFDNSLQWTMGWRVQSMDPRLGNGPFFAEGDYKFPKSGDMVTNRIQDLVEFQGIYQGRMGFRTSATFWKDFAYNDHVKTNPNATFQALNSYPSGKYNNYTKHYFLEGGDWLDGFVFYNTDIAGMPVYAKVGRLSQYWGNAFFFGFSNIAYSQSPIDFIKAFTQPGSEVKELFLPRNQILLQADITPELSVTGEYFLEYRPNIYPEGGTYFGFFDILFKGPATSGFVGLGPQYGNVEPPNNNHNYGLRVNWSPAWAGGDMGFYYRQLDEVDPWPLLRPTFDGLNNRYAQKVKLLGFSYGKSFGLLSTGFELNQRRHTELNSTLAPGADGQGARGEITNFIANGMLQLGTTPLWNSGYMLAEISYTHLNKVQDNVAQYNGLHTANCTKDAGGVLPGSWRDGCSTNNSLAFATLFVPQWPQVWSGVDLELPISYTWGVHGNPAYRASAFYAQQTNIYSIGLRAIYKSKNTVTLSYNGNNWRTGGTTVGPAGPFYAGFGGNGPVGVNDRGWLSLAFKTSF